MHKFYVSKQLRRYIIIAPIVLGSVFLIPMLLIGSTFGVFVSIIGAFFSWGVMFILHNKAFMKVAITDEGIGTKYLFLTWEEIDKCGEYDIYMLDVFRYNYGIKTIEYDTIIGIGNTEGKNFIMAPRKEIVYFSVDKETFAALEECGRGKSKIIDEILDRFAV